MVKRFMDGGAIPNAYPFVSQNAPIPEPEDSVQVGAKPEPLDNVMPAMGPAPTFKKGGKVKKSSPNGAYAMYERFVNAAKPAKKAYAKGGVTRADGCITKGKTKGRMT